MIVFETMLKVLKLLPSVDLPWFHRIILRRCCPWGLVPGGAAGRSVELISGAFAREGFSPPQIDILCFADPKRLQI